MGARFRTPDHIHLSREKKSNMSAGKFLLLAATLALAAELVSAEYIKRIEVLTTDCETCGMGPLGKLDVKVCGIRSGLRCCTAKGINNLFANNFEPGQIDVFEAKQMGD